MRLSDISEILESCAKILVFKSGDSRRNAIVNKNISFGSVESWVVFVSNIHDETEEDEVHDRFFEFDDIRRISLNKDRRSGFNRSGFNKVSFLKKILICMFLQFRFHRLFAYFLSTLFYLLYLDNFWFLALITILMKSVSVAFLNGHLTMALS